MKTKIELILGFLESGKTNFINSMIKSHEFHGETIVIIQDEIGQTEIDYSKDELKHNNINLITMENYSDHDIDKYYIMNIINKYSPHRIFIEANGMKNPKLIINLFDDRDIKKLCKIDDIIAITDAERFTLYLKNIKDLTTYQIINSNKIILNNLSELNPEQLNKIIDEVKNINETAIIFGHSSYSKEINGDSYDEYYEITSKRDNSDSNIFNFKTYIYIFLIMFIFTFLSGLTLCDSSVYSEYMDKFQQFYTIFISILIEGIPFILLGSFISAIIQICIPKELFMRIFPHNIFLSCIFASFAGFFFPICDCGTLPIVKEFIRKKVATAACITFMLAAPIVNPIAIMSTFYAFQDMKSVVIYRITFGIIISICVGLLTGFFTKNNSDILKDNYEIVSECNCEICSDSDNSKKNLIEKIKSIFIHTGDEFFNIGKFMIIGAFFSSIVQNITSLNNSIYIPNDNRTSLILMMILAFFLSVCSTSDAFVAKGFLKSFSINSVMGFLVFGPMLDLKNTFMLFGNFKKNFVLKLMFFIVIISLTVLININIL